MFLITPSPAPLRTPLPPFELQSKGETVGAGKGGGESMNKDTVFIGSPITLFEFFPSA